MPFNSDSGSASANSYVSVAYADEYFLSHPFYAETWADIQPAQKEFLLEAATRDIDSMFDWKGYVSSSTQALRWPRTGVVDLDGRPIMMNFVPDRLKQAVCEQARYLSSSAGNPDAPSDTQGVTELRVDVITLKFEQSEARGAVPKAVVRLLRGLGMAYSSSRVGRVQVRV
jgi:hypothetical protein